VSLTSAAERRSATSVGLPWRGTLPLPDGSIGGGDRGQVAAFYRGQVVSLVPQINTRARRRAAIHVGLPWRGIIPAPDGEIEKSDRVEVAVFYRGFFEPTPIVPDTGGGGGGGGGRSRRRGMPQLTRPAEPVVRRVRPRPIMTDDDELALLIPLMMEVLTNANAR